MKEVAFNRRALFDYEIIEKYEAGIELTGQEVKSIVSGHINLSGSYAILRNGEIWLLNADIQPYQPKNAPKDYDPKRTRRLLLHHEEITNLIGRTKEKGLTLVPLRVYLKRNRVKLEVGLARSKKSSDKRETIKKRETEREIARYT